MTYKVGVFIGSLAKESINRKLANALMKMSPASLDLREIPIKDLPLYSYDYDANYPQEAKDFKDAIEHVDALLFVTPEYNRSIPGALKNAIDWGSRPWGKNSFALKPSAVIGASIGAIGTAVGQQHLRSILSYVNSPELAQPEVYIHFRPDMINDKGEIAIESTKKFFADWFDKFAIFIDKVSTAEGRAKP